MRTKRKSPMIKEFEFHLFESYTGQMAQVIRHLLLLRELWS